MLHLREDQVPLTRWLDANLALMVGDLGVDQPGGEVLATRLTDMLVLHALRAHAARAGPGTRAGSVLCAFPRSPRRWR